MAQITFQQMCAQFARRAGVNGQAFSSVLSTDRTEVMITEFVREADLYIQGLYLDWAFLWAEVSGTLTAASDEMPRASLLNVIDVNSVVLQKGTATNHRVDFMPWKGQFFEQYELGVKQTSDTPSHFSEKPSLQGAFILSTKAETAVSYYYEYFKTPQGMSGDSDVSDIVLYDTELGNIIVSKALMDYCGKVSNPEVMQVAAAQYEDLLPRLEAKAGGEITRREYMRGGHADEMLVVSVE